MKTIVIIQFQNCVSSRLFLKTLNITIYSSFSFCMTSVWKQSTQENIRT